MHVPIVPVHVCFDNVTSRVTELVLGVVVAAVDPAPVLEAVFWTLLRRPLIPPMVSTGVVALVRRVALLAQVVQEQLTGDHVVVAESAVGWTTSHVQAVMVIALERDVAHMVSIWVLLGAAESWVIGLTAGHSATLSMELTHLVVIRRWIASLAPDILWIYVSLVSLEQIREPALRSVRRRVGRHIRAPAHATVRLRAVEELIVTVVTLP